MPYATPRSLAVRIVQRLTMIVTARLPAGRWLRRVPMLSGWYGRRLLDRRDHTGLHWGVFASFGEALAAVPAERRAGWDHAEAASLWVDNIAPVIPSTYPVLFWLRQLLEPGSAIVDLGGSIGLTYYGYRRYAALPPDVRWTVVEVPQIASQGRLVAERERATALHFEDDLAQVQRCDLLLCAGAMQYLDASVTEVLRKLPAAPRHIVLNKLPVSPAAEAWTLQNFGPAVAPMRLYNRAALLEAFAKAGYRLLDSWAVENLDCLIPFHPERYIASFSGFVFERIDAGP